MALNCPVNVVYHTSSEQKLRTKDAAYRYKYGSPKIRDLLREKCRARVRDARRQSFDKSRNGDNTALIKKILREEVAELEEDLKLQELIYQEMLEEANEWFIDEYEKQENYLFEVITEDTVFCPICQKCCLRQDSNELVCECGSKFHYPDALESFHKKIQTVLSEHEQNCNKELVFFVEPGSDDRKRLNALCESCEYFCNF